MESNGRDRLSGATIAHILPFPGVGGTEIGTLRVMKALEPLGVKNIAINLQKAEAIKAFFEEARVPVVEWPAPEPSIRHGLPYWRTSRAMADELKRLGVNMVACADYAAGYHASLAGSLAGVPVLCHVRNRHSDISSRDQIFLRPVDHFAFVSKDTWNRFAYRVPAKRGTVVYDGIDPPDDAAVAAGRKSAADVKAEFGLSESCKLIGMVARVAPQKDYDTLVRAASIVAASHPEARFLIIGDNSISESNRKHFEYVSGLVSAAGLEKTLVFTGYRSDTFRLLASLDCAVLSTHHEGLPLALIETLAFGKATVASSVDGVPELIEDGVNGFLCAHEDAETMANKLLVLLDDPGRAAELGRAARNTVLSTFTSENFSRNIAALYRTVLR